MIVRTVNVPIIFIEAFNRICGKGKLYPSRSEVVRIALREYLLEELQNLDKYKNLKEKTELFFPRIESFEREEIARKLILNEEWKDEEEPEVEDLGNGNIRIKNKIYKTKKQN